MLLGSFINLPRVQFDVEQVTESQKPSLQLTSPSGGTTAKLSNIIQANMKRNTDEVNFNDDMMADC